MNDAIINGIECLVIEGKRKSIKDAPPEFPYFYESRHHNNDWSFPISIETAVTVNFWGTVFSKEPLLEKGISHINIKSIEYKGLSLDSMPEVCPICAGCLATGDVVITGSTAYVAVECGCGYKGREEYWLSSYTATAADEEYDGDPADGVTCPACHSEVVLPEKVTEFDAVSMFIQLDCPYCGAMVETSISCNFEGSIPLPMPA